MAARADVLVHMVLISFRPDAPEEKRHEVYDRYQTLDRDCGGIEAGIYYWKVAHNLDLRKGVHLVELAIFRDNDALQAFRVHPKHQELTNLLREVADWQVGDMTTPLYELAFLDAPSLDQEGADPTVPASSIPAEFADESMCGN